MDDDHVFIPQDEPADEEIGAGKKFLIVFSAVLLLLAVAGGSYFLGSRNKADNTAVLSPTPLAEIITSSPTPTIQDNTSTISGSITPTKKLSGTPSLTITPVIKQKTLTSDKALDGFQSSNGGGNKTLDIRSGRNVNLVSRGFVSFDLSDIPAGITVKEATLRLYQAKIIGNPYTAGGSLKVDHLNFGDTLDNSDYGLAALSSSFTILTSNNTLEWKDAVVTDQVKDDIANGRSRSQFRIHFQTENTGGDATGDFVYFESADNSQSSGNTPQLIVKYY